MLYRRSLLLALGVLAFASGCGEEGQLDEASASCKQTRTSLSPEETTLLGQTSAELFGAIQLTYSGDLNFTPEGSTTLTLSPGVMGAATFVDQEPEENSSGGEIDTLEAAYCEDFVEIQTQLLFETEDGLFGETFDVALNFFVPGTARFSIDVVPSALAGSYDFMVMDPAEYDEVTASLYGDLVSDGSSSGTLSEVGTKVEGEGDDGTASASLATVAEWSFPAVAAD